MGGYDMSTSEHKDHAFDAYSAIARVYDRLNAEIDYAAWGDFVETCFSRYLNDKPELLLDLACGTGKLTNLFLHLGCTMGTAQVFQHIYFCTHRIPPRINI